MNAVRPRQRYLGYSLSELEAWLLHLDPACFPEHITAIQTEIEARKADARKVIATQEGMGR